MNFALFKILFPKHIFICIALQNSDSFDWVWDSSHYISLYWWCTSKLVSIEMHTKITLHFFRWKRSFAIDINKKQNFCAAAKLTWNKKKLRLCGWLTHACGCFGGWSGAIEPGCRDNNGIPPARRTPDGVLVSCINGIFDEALSLDNISSRSIWEKKTKTPEIRQLNRSECNLLNAKLSKESAKESEREKMRNSEKW